MIVETMTKETILKEMQSDLDWIRDMGDGWCKKYNRQLKNKKLGDMTLLEHKEYLTPNYNKLSVLIYKVLLYKGQANFYIIPYFKTYMGYITPVYDTGGIKVISTTAYSSHAVDRIKERLGMDFKTFMQKKGGGAYHLDYHFNDCPDETVAALGDFGFGFFRTYKWGMICTTVLSKEQLKGNQKDLLKEAFEETERCKTSEREIAIESGKAAEKMKKIFNAA